MLEQRSWGRLPGGDRNREQKELRTPLAERLAAATSVPRFASGFPVKARSLEATIAKHRNVPEFVFYTRSHTCALRDLPQQCLRQQGDGSASSPQKALTVLFKSLWHLFGHQMLGLERLDCILFPSCKGMFVTYIIQEAV